MVCFAVSTKYVVINVLLCSAGRTILFCMNALCEEKYDFVKIYSTAMKRGRVKGMHYWADREKRWRWPDSEGSCASSRLSVMVRTIVVVGLFMLTH